LFAAGWCCAERKQGKWEACKLGYVSEVWMIEEVEENKMSI
jgi:hypothetical protein